MLKESLNKIKEGIQPFVNKPIAKVYKLVQQSAVLIEFEDLSNKVMSFNEIVRLSPGLSFDITVVDIQGKLDKSKYRQKSGGTIPLTKSMSPYQIYLSSNGLNQHS